MKVRLTKDLTSYGPSLVVGAEGLAREGRLSINDWEQEMVEVKIPGSYSLPIGWNALEIIDKKFWKDREKAVKRASSIILRVGPRGGYKGMVIEWEDVKGNFRKDWCNNKLESERTMELAKKYNKYVSQEIVR